MSFEDLKREAEAKQREAVSARLDALSMAVEYLFDRVPSGKAAREAFMSNFQSLAEKAQDPAHQKALQDELQAWKNRTR